MTAKKGAPFDGKRFDNLVPKPDKTFADVSKMMRESTRGPWPKWAETKQTKPRERVGEGELEITFINHATLLIQLDGKNILTDPVYSERCSPVQFAGPKRIREPGVRMEDLPQLDLILVSHNHYDHLDVQTLKRLSGKHDAQVITPLKNDALIRGCGFKNVSAMDWWDEQSLHDFEITCLPAQHWSSRSMFDRRQMLWSAFGIRSKRSEHSVYFAGDTGYEKHFVQTREVWGAPEVALLPIGAYEPQWFMRDMHMNPEEAVQAHFDLQAKHSIAFHFGTFALASDSFADPPERLLREAQRTSADFVALQEGETRRY